MELRDLRYFLVVGEELNFTRSAERLYIAPSAVSERIRRLEAELALPLFERTSRRVALTDSGRELLPAARRVLAAADELTALAGARRVQRRGALVIAFAPNLGQHAGALLNMLAARSADVEVDARSMLSAEALSALERGQVSAALVRVPVDNFALASQLVDTYADDFVALPEAHRLAGHDRISIESLHGETVLVSEAEDARHVHESTVAFFREHGVAPRIKPHRLQAYDSILAMVSAGVGLALVHSHLADMTVPGVAIRPLLEPGPRYELRVAWRKADGSVGARAIADAAASLPHSP